MKVLSITPKRTQQDNKPYWKVGFTDTNCPLIMWDEPTFGVGADIQDDELIFDNEKRVYSLRTDRRTIESSEKDASIREQTAIKAIIELFIAKRLEDFEESQDPVVVNARRWLNAALIHGPLMSGILEGEIHDLMSKESK